MSIDSGDLQQILTAAPCPPCSDLCIEQSFRLLRVYKALLSIFKNEQQANSWIHKPNDYYAGHTALSAIVSDPTKLEGLVCYLEYQLV